MSIITIDCTQQGEHELHFAKQTSAFRLVLEGTPGQSLHGYIWWISEKARLRVVLQDPVGAVVEDRINQPAVSGLRVGCSCSTAGKYSLFVAPVSVPSPSWRFRVRVGSRAESPVCFGRRWPVLSVVDISKTMSESQIEHARLSIDAMRTALLCDPMALETVYLSCIAFDEHACALNREFVELTVYEAPLLRQNHVADGDIGSALYAASSYLWWEVRRQNRDEKGDWRPYVFLFSNCLCTKGWDTLPQAWACRFNLVVFLPPGGASQDQARRLSEQVVRLDDVPGGDYFRVLFKWVS